MININSGYYIIYNSFFEPNFTIFLQNLHSQLTFTFLWLTTQSVVHLWITSFGSVKYAKAENSRNKILQKKDVCKCIRLSWYFYVLNHLKVLPLNYLKGLFTSVTRVWCSHIDGPLAFWLVSEAHSPSERLSDRSHRSDYMIRPRSFCHIDTIRPSVYKFKRLNGPIDLTPSTSNRGNLFLRLVIDVG